MCVNWLVCIAEDEVKWNCILRYDFVDVCSSWRRIECVSNCEFTNKSFVKQVYLFPRLCCFLCALSLFASLALLTPVFLPLVLNIFSQLLHITLSMHFFGGHYCTLVTFFYLSSPTASVLSFAQLKLVILWVSAYHAFFLSLFHFWLLCFTVAYGK